MAGRCECCDKPLSYKESTARFLTADDEPRRYTGMCIGCMSFLNVPIIMRGDLPDTDPTKDEENDEYDNEEGFAEDE